MSESGIMSVESDFGNAGFDLAKTKAEHDLQKLLYFEFSSFGSCSDRTALSLLHHPHLGIA